MKRSLIATLLLTAAVAGCDRGPSTAYNPQYDGITPISRAAPDLTILQDQRQLYTSLAKATGNPTLAPATATTAPNAAPANRPAPGPTPPPPPG